MKAFSSLKFAPAIAPALVDDAAFTGIAIDRAGANEVFVVVQIGVTDIALTELKLTECDTSGGSYDDVPSCDYSVTTVVGMNGSVLGLPSATDDGKLFGFYIPEAQARQRYLKVAATAGDGTAGVNLSALAILSHNPTAPNGVVEAGFTQVAQG